MCKKPKKIKKNLVIPKPKSKNQVATPSLPSNRNFTFYSCYNWIHAVDLYKTISFTNMCKDKEQFADEIIEILTVTIPKIYQDWEGIFNSGGANRSFRHCHVLEGAKLDISKSIAEEIHQTEFDPDSSWWELGFNGGVRIIGIYDPILKNFYPFFVDRHHLIYPDKNYNRNDFEKYSYNPKFKTS
jgi:hypothetical protein